MQTAILLSASTFGVMVTTLLGPSVPQMQRHFDSVHGAAYLVPLALTIPMLTMAVFSVLAGMASDRVGRKRMLVLALLCYAVIGIAPLWIESLYTIIGTRVLLGAFDAIIVTTGIALVGDYFCGERRSKVLALSTTTASLSAVALTLIGGVLGGFGWRTPYAIYGIALVIAPLAQLFLWEPAKADVAVPELQADSGGNVIFRPWLLAGICAIGVFVGVIFISVPIHLGYMMGALHVEAPQAIGVVQAVNSAGVVLGTLLFGWVLASRLRVGYQFAIAVCVIGLGSYWMGNASSYSTLTVAAMLHGIGCGVIHPTILTWNMRELPFAKRGAGTGALMSSVFLGMSINPIVVVYLSGLQGGRAGAFASMGQWLLVVAAAVCAFAILGRVRNRPASSVTRGTR
jgi:MFS family permease